MEKIELKYKDFICKESYSNVYRYKINNTELVVKYFYDETKAKEENAFL